jgi:hypothetical protein
MRMSRSLGFLRRGPISPRLHGTLDLIVAPFVLGFSDHTAAMVLYVAIGAGGLGATLLTRFESDLEPAMHAASARPAV